MSQTSWVGPVVAVNKTSFRDIFRVWWPLAGTWMMMAFEGPFISALIARQGDPIINLAAFGIAFTIGMLMEAPIIMMMAAAVRLVKDRLSFLKLRNFTFSLNLIITITMLGFLTPAFYEWFAFKVLALDPQIAALTRSACFWLLPWPAMIGYRRFYQGILIREGASRSVALGTIVRLMTLVSTALYLARFTHMHGASLGAISLSVAVTIEAIAVRLLAIRPLRRVYAHPIAGESYQLNYLKLINFYYPLALTAILGLASQPAITFAMNRARLPLESLALLPVINGLSFFFRAIALSFQEAIISLLGHDERNYKPLQRFAWLLAGLMSLVYTLIAFTPLADLWFIRISGLEPDLAALAILPLQIMLLTPALNLLLCWQRSHLIHLGHTGPITSASLIELFTIAGVLSLGIIYFQWAGVVAAAAALLAGRLASSGFLAAKNDGSRISHPLKKLFNMP